MKKVPVPLLTLLLEMMKGLSFIMLGGVAAPFATAFKAAKTLSAATFLRSQTLQ